MRKVLSLLLALVLCLGLCACTTQDQKDHAAKEEAEAMDFKTQMCGCFEYLSGWSEPGTVIEFREDGTCTINNSELKWDTISKVKPGQTAPREYANIYSGDELVYEAYVKVWDDGTIALVISEENETGSYTIPDGIYVKTDEHEH